MYIYIYLYAHIHIDIDRRSRDIGNTLLQWMPMEWAFWRLMWFRNVVSLGVYVLPPWEIPGDKQVAPLKKETTLWVFTHVHLRTVCIHILYLYKYIHILTIYTVYMCTIKKHIYIDWSSQMILIIPHCQCVFLVSDIYIISRCRLDRQRLERMDGDTARVKGLEEGSPVASQLRWSAGWIRVAWIWCESMDSYDSMAIFGWFNGDLMGFTRIYSLRTYVENHQV